MLPLCMWLMLTLVLSHPQSFGVQRYVQQRALHPLCVCSWAGMTSFLKHCLLLCMRTYQLSSTKIVLAFHTCIIFTIAITLTSCASQSSSFLCCKSMCTVCLECAGKRALESPISASSPVIQMTATNAQSTRTSPLHWLLQRLNLNERQSPSSTAGGARSVEVSSKGQALPKTARTVPSMHSGQDAAGDQLGAAGRQRGRASAAADPVAAPTAVVRLQPSQSASDLDRVHGQSLHSKHQQQDQPQLQQQEQSEHHSPFVCTPPLSGESLHSPPPPHMSSMGTSSGSGSSASDASSNKFAVELAQAFVRQRHQNRVDMGPHMGPHPPHFSVGP